MLKAVLVRLLVAYLLSSNTGACAVAVPATVLANEVAAISERVYLAPVESLKELSQIQESKSPLSASIQALVYEQSSKARFFGNDFMGALQDAKRLEALGQQLNDSNLECLGVLSQAYAYWMMGRIQAAYDLAHRAVRFSSSSISVATHVKTLVMAAQLNSEEHHALEAIQKSQEALRFANDSHDDSLIFMAANAGTRLALETGDIQRALNSMNQLLDLAARSRYRERMIRARAMEFTVSSAAGLTERADYAMREKLRLMRELNLVEMLGRTLVDYSDFKLKTDQFLAASQLADEALHLQSALTDEQLNTQLRFNHAIADVHLGMVARAQTEIERVLQTQRNSPELLVLLFRYIVALNQVGQGGASLKLNALLQRIEVEDNLRAKKISERAQGQIDSLVDHDRASTLEVQRERAQHELWPKISLSALAGMVGILLLYARLRTSNQRLAETNRSLYQLSNRDSLTGLFNRRYVESNRLRKDVEDRRVISTEFGFVCLIDIDNFKALNDTHGHAAGDKVLKIIAGRIASLFRDEDMVCRWGGEEFVVLLDATPLSEAAGIAARLLSSVSASPVILDEAPINVTISLGICRLHAVINGLDLSWEDVVNLADQAMYLAKENGKNRAYGIVETSNVGPSVLAKGLREHWSRGTISLLEV